MKYDEAFNKKDAGALAALFTEDAVYVTPEGLFSGRQAIERWYVDHFQRWHMINHIHEANQLNAIGNEVCSLGQWWNTLQSENGPVFVRGYWSALFVREGDAWRIRMLTYNKTSPAALPDRAPDEKDAPKADHLLRGSKSQTKSAAPDSANGVTS